MKVSELIEQLKGCEDFEMEFLVAETVEGNFPNFRVFSVTEINDIGYSDKVIVLAGEEQF